LRCGIFLGVNFVDISGLGTCIRMKSTHHVVENSRSATNLSRIMHEIILP
jgi:hypothetical protein